MSSTEVEDEYATTPSRRARRLIDENDHMTIVDATGTPWVSPVFYVPDDDHNLHWVSATRARHSENIRGNSAIAGVIYETDPVDAVYISADAVELSDPGEVAPAAEIVGRKPQPDRLVIKDLNDVLGESPWRIYRAAPSRIDVCTDGVENGKAVVDRVQADFRLHG